MKSYMPQDVFDMGAVTTALLTERSDLSAAEIAEIIVTQYRHGYVDDGIAEDLVKAAEVAAGMLRSEVPPEAVGAALTQLQFCIRNYHPSGRKKSRFFRGAIFNKQKTPIADRVTACQRNVVIFYIGTTTGRFPIMPRGWSFGKR